VIYSFELIVGDNTHSSDAETVLRSGSNIVSGFHLTSGAAHMPRIGYGTAAIQEKTKDLVCGALDAGFRLFDTAQVFQFYEQWYIFNLLSHLSFKLA
jgi:hypothetical protein